ncbi:MAG TPA: carboxypeptidase-like regulatory domain-containing protein, partial [Bacteroidota bacterium]|nr:carboxypeptidase-like regulatory domain-containing protein [Bacteroidota bacterium]
MHMSIRYRFLPLASSIVLSVLLSAQAAFSAGSGTVRGKVFDRTSKDALPGANVQVKGTGLGMATDLDGKFSLKNVPTGEQTLTVSYIGYEKISVKVTVVDGGTVDKDIGMDAVAVQGETIVVTGQARGQMSAINQQLASNSIINVVSADKMKELPDANLAESIGRLPGISLQRNAGEAYAVVVRGLSPKYNEITLEGIPMTSTNYYDRSVDLSLLSDDVVRSVEVSKTLRPDLDADALGGTVNLTLKSADPGFHFNVLTQGAYNRLRDTYGNYKFTGSMSNRYLDDRFGLLLQGNVERKQLPSDQFAAGYQSPQYNSAAKEFLVNTQNATLTELDQVRNRYGASAILDYASDAVDLKFFMVYDQKRDSVKQRTDQSSFVDNSFYYNINANQTKTEQTTSSLSALFKPWGTELPMTFSYTRGTANTPNAMEFDFIQTNVPPLAPNQVIYGAPFNLVSLQGVMNPGSVNSTLNNMTITDTHLTDESFDARIDWKVPFRLSDFLSGKISVGGKSHGVTRTSDQTQVRDYMLYGAGAGNRADLINTFAFLSGQNVSLQAGVPALPFVDPNYSRTNILGYPIGPGFDINKLIDMQNYYYFTLQNQPKYWQDGPQDYDHNYR